MVVFIGICLGVLLFLSPVLEAVPHPKESSTLEDAQLEYLSRWSRVADLYRTDSMAQRAIDYSVWYHQQQASGRADDPRPPAADIPAVPFTCNPGDGVSPLEPQTAHELRIGDISVIGALGDSITAGNGLGAENVLLVLAENRGESWSIGGDFSLEMNVTTIPNMMRKYREDTKGHSLCTGPEQDFEYAWFNVAVPGARAVHMQEQAMDLVDRMKNDERIIYAKDWKLITLYIGGNDLCGYCHNKESRSPAMFKSHIQDALDYLHDHVPRAFVNLVPMADVSAVQNVTFHHPNTSYPGEPDPEILYPWLCDLFHNIFCDCVMNDTTRAELKSIQLQYYDVMEELVDSARYDTKDDFVVVLQPHQRDAEAVKDPLTGLTDNRYFAPDCFHPNRRMHQVFAFQLWNAMHTRVGQKPFGDDPLFWEDYVCPTSTDPYLWTKENSIEEEQPAAGAGQAAQQIVTMATVITMVTAIKQLL